MKLNQKLIQQLRNGEITVENNGPVEQLREVLKVAFPHESVLPTGSCQYYSRSATNTYGWMAYSLQGKGKPTVKISDFYQPELFTGWAKDDNSPKWMVYFKNDVVKFGFDTLGEWHDEIESPYYKYSKDRDNRPATHEEIESTLIKEAKRRGYKGGNTIKGIHGTIHPTEEISFRYEKLGNRLVTNDYNDYCVVFENGQWAEIIEQPKDKPKTNPIHYTVDGTTYSLNYQELKFRYEDICQYSDEQFMEELPEIAHLACVVSFFKGLGSNATIGDKGIIHELIHLMTEPNEPTNNLQEIRESFNDKIKLS